MATSKISVVIPLTGVDCTHAQSCVVRPVKSVVRKLKHSTWLALKSLRTTNSAEGTWYSI